MDSPTESECTVRPSQTKQTKLELALRSSQSLLETLESFQSDQDSVLGLIGELRAFEQALLPLQQVIENADVRVGLDYPLSHCNDACKGFEKSIEHADGSVTNSTAWLESRYMGDDFVRFTMMLAAYKSVFTIVIGVADRPIIDRTKKYFETRLLRRRDKLHDLSAQAEDATQQDNIYQSISHILRQIAHKACDDDLKVLDEHISQSVSRSSGLRKQRRQLEREIECIKLCMCICIEASENPGLAGAKLLGKVRDIVGQELVKRSTAEERWTKLD